MKKIIIINMILLFLIYIIPIKKNVVTENIIANIENVITQNVDQIEISSRSLEEPRVEEVKSINLELTVDSDLRIISNLKADDFNKMLEGTNLSGLGGALEQAEKEHGVNGLYLMGLACLESGYGTSNYAVNRNNLVGWNAVNSNPNKASYFDSKEECILYVAEKLKTNYLSENGCYFNGYSARAIDVKYCSDKEHADKIVQIVNKLKNKI